jgi:hypothetical protein
MLKFYSNTFSQASRSAAAFLFTIALLLVGFGVLIVALPEVFAILAATLFFIAGGSCAIFALKMYIASRRIRHNENAQYHTGYDSGGRIHELDDFDK